MTYCEGGSLAKVKFDRYSSPERARGAKRGTVKGFSAGSRRRMLEAVNAVDASRVKGTFFGTLTARPMSHKAFKACVGAWYRRLERQWVKGSWSLLWRFEAHESGSLHLHFLMLWTKGLPHLVREFRPWNDNAWAAVCGSENVGRGACNVQLIQRVQHAGFYVGKYCAKVGEGTTGRVWGIKRREHWPVSRVDRRVSKAVGLLVGRQFRRLVCARARTFLVTSAAWPPLVNDDGTPGKRRWERRPADDSMCRCWQSGPAGRRSLRMLGWTVRVWTPRVQWSSTDRIWAEVVERNGERVSRKLELVGEERSTRSRAAFVVRGDDAKRLLEWAEREYLRRLEAAG